ncbi:uncharacterized protein [Narcine bancroftii]|uniref:uncharacterized protein n=1 Tax=Narcine bancroftii TaxID=1343680 RepID=UPI0038316966
MNDCQAACLPSGPSILLAEMDAALKQERLKIGQSVPRAREIFNHWILVSITTWLEIRSDAMGHEKPRESDAANELALDSLANQCDVRAVNVQQHRSALKLDASVNRIYSSYIQQSLLETEPLTYDRAVTLVKTLRSAMRSSKMLETKKETSRSAGTPKERKRRTPEKCTFCDKSWHSRQKCLARFATCSYCGKLGHFAKASKEKSTPTDKKKRSTKKMCPGAAGMEDNSEKGESSDEQAESTSSDGEWKSGTVMDWPDCLSEPGTVLLKSHTLTHKTDPLIQGCQTQIHRGPKLKTWTKSRAELNIY